LEGLVKLKVFYQ